jgi:bacterioferritin-associated ferredoxin
MSALGLPRAGLDALTPPDTVVCRCEGVTRAAIEREIAAGAATTNAVKSGTRCGMGPCGGRFCQTAVARIIERARSLPPGSVAPPTARPPLRPVPVAAVAGRFQYEALPIPAPAPL